MNKSYLVFFVKTIPYSLGIFLLILISLNSLKTTEYYNDNDFGYQVKTHEDEIFLQVLKRHQAITDCLKNRDLISQSCVKIAEEKLNQNLLKTLYIGEWPIIIIYMCLFITLNIQIALFRYTSIEKELGESFLYLSQWAINTPPIFGILGTILSFSLAMNHLKLIGIQEFFLHYFFGTIIPIMIGYIFYTINLLLKVKIHPYIKVSVKS